MAQTILGLDIGGANLKAATADKRAVSVPFPLWKQPDKLPAALAELVAKFPEAEELAVTMTGELCDCFETKRDGVHAIVKAVRFASAGRPIRVWSTDGAFLNSEEAKANHMKVAASNWHALGTFAGRYVPEGLGMLFDIGSTTTDIIPLVDGTPASRGRTDPERLMCQELVYLGTRRTPICALPEMGVAAELFATTLDVYLILGMIAENPEDTDTADGRTATRAHAHARLSRMRCSDPELMAVEETAMLAEAAHDSIMKRLDYAFGHVRETAMLTGELQHRGGFASRTVLAGSGEFLARALLIQRNADLNDVVSLTDSLGGLLSACAPAYAVAVLAAERRA